MSTPGEHPALLLRQATRTAHKTTEALSYGSQIMAGELTLAEYYHLLETHYAVHRAVNKALDVHLPADHELRSFLDTNVLKDIEKDLPLLKTCSIQPIPASIFSIDQHLTENHCCGALYVLEGSRLGARIILKHLPQCVALSHLDTFHFYQQQTNVNRHHWKNFIDLMNTILSSPQAVRQAIRMANQIFAAYHFYLAHPPSRISPHLS